MTTRIANLERTAGEEQRDTRFTFLELTEITEYWAHPLRAHLRDAIHLRDALRMDSRLISGAALKAVNVSRLTAGR